MSRNRFSRMNTNIKVYVYKVKGLAKLETNLDGGRSFSRILFAFHHSWKWVGFELSLNWDANELNKARDNRFLCLRDASIFLVAQYFPPASHSSRKKPNLNLVPRSLVDEAEGEIWPNLHYVITCQECDRGSLRTGSRWR